jgi:hypothetical protein
MASAARNTQSATAAATEAEAVTTKADADLTRTTAAPAETEAPMSAADAPAVSAADDPQNAGKVPIKLANPIDNPEHMRRLRLVVKEGGYNVHDVVYLTPDDARAVITAGLAQVDPEDKKAVRAAITGQPQDA